MWSVTEQNRLHYTSIMCHRRGLVLWWPPSHRPPPASPLFLHGSVFLSSINVRLVRPHSPSNTSFFSTLISFYFLPPLPPAPVHSSSPTSTPLCGVSTLLHHPSLLYLHSFFFLPLILLCFEMLPSVCTRAALVMFAHLFPLLSCQIYTASSKIFSLSPVLSHSYFSCL